jgi:hypothetical protein
MTKQDKIIAGITLAQGLLGVAWTLAIASRLGFPVLFLVCNLVLAAAGIISGIGCFKGLRWAAVVGLIFFGVQVLQVVTPTFQFSFSLGFKFIVSMGWIDSGKVGVNLIAAWMTLWIGGRLVATGSPFKRVQAGTIAE